MCRNSTRRSQRQACRGSEQARNRPRGNPYPTPGADNTRQSSLLTEQTATAVGIPDEGDQEVDELQDKDLLMFTQQPDVNAPELGHVKGAHEHLPLLRATTSAYLHWEAPTSNPHLQMGKTKSQLTLSTSTPCRKKYVYQDGALPCSEHV
ncbi:hypothetical protein PCASD_26241 [Puccinia coronata f. sp. avenae]|uniref:Uncharacterized protein n=1 Tax=Puccinia coronata f. sp. avenae TaxID=200324 RepID=A0A2N5RXH1_9BASI|nr:hypothetical protein PCASD_26241 [Puccinia coronata f. sp. avenae]